MNIDKPSDRMNIDTNPSLANRLKSLAELGRLHRDLNAERLMKERHLSTVKQAKTEEFQKQVKVVQAAIEDEPTRKAIDDIEREKARVTLEEAKKKKEQEEKEELAQWFQEHENKRTGLPNPEQRRNEFPMVFYFPGVLVTVSQWSNRSGSHKVQVHKDGQPEIVLEGKMSNATFKRFKIGDSPHYNTSAEDFDFLKAVYKLCGWFEYRGVTTLQRGSGELKSGYNELSRLKQAWKAGNHSPVIKKEIRTLLTKLADDGKINKKVFFEAIGKFE